MNDKPNFDTTKKILVLIVGMAALHALILFALTDLIADVTINLWAIALSAVLNLVGICYIAKETKREANDCRDALLRALDGDRKLFWLVFCIVIACGGALTSIIKLSVPGYTGLALSHLLGNVQILLSSYLIIPRIWKHVPNYPAT